MKKYKVAICIALVVAIAYILTSLLCRQQLDFRSQAALVGVSAFSLTTSSALLWDLSQFGDDDMGRLGGERTSLIIGLIFVCIYVPLSVGQSFADVVQVGKASAGLPAVEPVAKN